MARSLYGGRIGDTVGSLYSLGRRQLIGLPVDESGNPASVTLEVYDEVEGTQLTDLLAADGSTAIEVVTVPSTGEIPEFYGPDGVNVYVYVRDPDGDFFRMDARADALAEQVASDAEQVAEDRAAVEAIGNTNDGIIQGRIADTGSATSGELGEAAQDPSHPLGAALSATFVPTVDGKARRDKLRTYPRASTPDPNRVRAVPAATYLTTPTPDATGSAVHPDVCFIPEGWNGYRWWMVYEPYAGSDNALENPCVVVSTDGITWAAPAGLTNPVEPTPGVGYNSDGELVLDHDGTMYLFFRTVAGANETYYYRTSTNGVTWTAKAQAHQVTGAASSRGMLSPSITWDGEQWCMFYIDSTANPAPAVIKKYTSPTLDGTWTFEANGTITLPAANSGQAQQAWHIDVVWTDGYFNALLNTGSAATQSNGGILLVFAVSTDGVAWTAATRPLMYHVGDGSTWDSAPYRGCLVPLTDGRWRVYYSANGTASWRIGYADTYTGVKFVNDKLAIGNDSGFGEPLAGIEVRPTTDVEALRLRTSTTGTADLIRMYDATGAVTRCIVKRNGGVWMGNYGGSSASDSGLGVFGSSELQNTLRVATGGGSLLLGDANTGSGVKVFAVQDATTAPSTNSAVGGVLYSQGGAGKWRTKDGTVRTFGGNVVAKSANYTAATDDSVVLATGGASGIAIGLPTGVKGAEIVVKKVDSGAGAVAVNSSQAIDGLTSRSLATQYAYLRMVSDGTTWHIVASG